MNTPWIDQPDAIDQISERTGDTQLMEVATQLIENGFAVLRSVVPASLCDAAVEDHREFVQRLGSDVARYQDANGRLLRLVNFHLSSDAAADIGTHPRIMEALDFLFGEEAAVYSSLYFEYGTQQPIHRDSPFFETFPRNYFVGVWVALEDISPDAGPLMYHPGAHRFHCDPHAIYDETAALMGRDSDASAILHQALESYYGRIIGACAQLPPPQRVPLRKGDVAIWHAQLPHGGSPAADPHLTRRSMVFHCSPISKQVYQHEVFFTYRGDTPPPPRYGFIDRKGRKVAASGDTAFQV